MRPFRQVVGLAALNLFSHSFASSLQPDTVDCETVTTGLSPSCWDQLNVNTWMQNWLATTSPNATSGAAAQCKSNELWSTCFLRLGLEVTGRDCSKISSNGEDSTCPMPRVGYPPHDPHIFYGVWNIYAINTYITTLFLAIQTLSQTSPATLLTAATTSANSTSRFTNTTQTLSVDLPLRILLEEETYGFYLPATPNAALLTFLATYPAVGQTYGRYTSVEVLVGLLQRRLSGVLGQVMSDGASFVVVADRGAFSTEEVVDEADLVEAWES